MTRNEIVTGLRAGRTLYIDRRDAPALPIVQELEAEGLVTATLEQLDEQSSRLRVRWAATPEGGEDRG